MKVSYKATWPGQPLLSGPKSGCLIQVWLYIHHMPYLRNSMVYNHDFWYTLGFFFHFFKILIFWVVIFWFSRVKGQEIVQNDKNFVCHAPYLRKHASYDRHLWYVKCEMIISQVAFFHFFKVLIFLGCSEGQKTKNRTKWLKTLSATPYISGTTHHMICSYGAHV